MHLLDVAQEAFQLGEGRHALADAAAAAPHALELGICATVIVNVLERESETKSTATVGVDCGDGVAGGLVQQVLAELIDVVEHEVALLPAALEDDVGVRRAAGGAARRAVAGALHLGHRLLVEPLRLLFKVGLVQRPPKKKKESRPRSGAGKETWLRWAWYLDVAGEVAPVVADHAADLAEGGVGVLGGDALAHLARVDDVARHHALLEDLDGLLGGGRRLHRRRRHRTAVRADRRRRSVHRVLGQVVAGAHLGQQRRRFLAKSKHVRPSDAGQFF